jgi:hypothetical protein
MPFGYLLSKCAVNLSIYLLSISVFTFKLSVYLTVCLSRLSSGKHVKTSVSQSPYSSVCLRSVDHRRGRPTATAQGVKNSSDQAHRDAIQRAVEKRGVGTRLKSTTKWVPV